MANKKDFINNLREYTSDEIAQAIKAGTVTMYELSKSGNMTPLMRKRIEAKLNAKEEAPAANDLAQPVQPQPVEVAPAQPIQPTPTAPTKASPSTRETENVSAAIPEAAIPEAVIPDAAIPDAAIPDAVIPEAVIPDATYIPEPVSSTVQAPTESTPQPTRAAKSARAQVNKELPSNKGMFKRPFSFSGRIRRTEYGISIIIYYIWYIITLSVISSSYLYYTSDRMYPILIFVYMSYIPMCWFMLAQNCKRCHDMGSSGWYQLIPFYNPFVLLFGDSEPNDNEYGDRPKM